MPDFVHVVYGQTGASQEPDAMGMRAMQARAVFRTRLAVPSLVKAPACIGQIPRSNVHWPPDKLQNQGIRKVIVAVPERSIRVFVSGQQNSLSTDSFRDWIVDDQWNLCTPGGDEGKVGRFPGVHGK